MFWRQFHYLRLMFFPEKRTRRMNLQLLRHGIRTRTGLQTGLRAAGFALASLMISTGLSAQTQVATHTQLSVARAKQVTLTAKVNAMTGSAASDGIVNFETASGSIGSATVENGVATLNVDALPPGTKSVTATYQGSEGLSASSTTAQADATTAPALPDFSITANPSSFSLNPGDFGTSTITITPISSFADMVTLSCSGLPNATVTCVFSPATPTPLNGNPVTSTLQIQTQAPSGTNNTSSLVGMTPGHIAVAVGIPGMLALVGMGTLRKRSGLNGQKLLGLAVLLAAGIFGMNGCAARYSYFHHPPSPNTGTVAGTYNITVAANANSGSNVISHSLNIVLTVK
jgi:hypothetical protein